MEKIVVAVIPGAIAVTCFIISYLQFHEKGFLFNNAYIYTSKKERETMDKAPYYCQSGTNQHRNAKRFNKLFVHRRAKHVCAADKKGDRRHTNRH